MDQGRKRWLIRLAVVIVVGVAGLWWTMNERTETLTIENHSGQTADLLEVTIAGQTCSFRKVAAHATVNAPCKVKEGDPFLVNGRLADGTHIRVSGRIGDSLHFQLLPGGEVKFRPRSKNPF